MSDVIETKYVYASAKSKKFSLAMVRTVIDRLLSNTPNGLYPYVEGILSEPGNTGRVSWDLCMAVQRVLLVDAHKDYGTGELTAMVGAKTLSLPALGAELIKVLRASNYIIERGRIVGVVEATDA